MRTTRQAAFLASCLVLALQTPPLLAAPLLANASLVPENDLPFSEESDLLHRLEQDYGPLTHLMRYYALAEICGLRTRHLQDSYLQRRVRLLADRDIDFDTLKALRYLAYAQVERSMRTAGPKAFRTWCDASAPSVLQYFSAESNHPQ